MKQKRIVLWLRVMLSFVLCMTQNMTVFAEEESETVREEEMTETLPEVTEETGSGEVLEEEESAEEDTETGLKAEISEEADVTEGEETEPEAADEPYEDVPDEEYYVEYDGFAHILQEGSMLYSREEASAFAGGFTYPIDENFDELTDRLTAAALIRDGELDVRDLGIPASEAGNVFQYLINNNPQLFYVKGQIGFFSNPTTGMVTTYALQYDNYTSSDIDAFHAKVSEILSGIDNSWNDEQKALYLHDVLVINNTYDETYSKSNAYNALVEGTSVCQGYSLAYKYLLNQAGIACDIISSDELVHAWNAVTLNGMTYYVDVTFDDPTGTYRMYCSHENFLLSRDEMIEAGHDSDDWVNTRGDVVFDTLALESYPGAYWSECKTRIPAVQSLWAYTKNDKNIYVHDYSSGTDSLLTDELQGIWHNPANPGSYYTKYYASLDSYHNFFLASQEDAVYTVKTDGTVSEIGKLDEDELAYGRIYGIQTVNDTVRYDVYCNPDINGELQFDYFDIPASEEGGNRFPVENYFDELTRRLIKAAENQEHILDVADLQIPEEDSDYVFYYLITHNPQLFYVTGTGSHTTNFTYVGTYTLQYPGYTQSDIDLFDERISRILSGIDSSWNDEQKALYLHDVLVTETAVDTTGNSRSIYDALVMGEATSRGYALAYKYLLNQAGIECDIIGSPELSHAWNAVVISGKTYYVDTVKDDQDENYVMYCGHANFLRSREGMREEGHSTTDWLNTKDENVYSTLALEEYPVNWWEDSMTKIPSAGKLYAYTKKDPASGIWVHDYSDGTDRVLTSELNGTWDKLDGEGAWTDNFTSLDSYHDQFLASRQDSVYLIKTDGTVRKVYALEDSEMNRGRIYGIKTTGDQVRYWVYSGPGSDNYQYTDCFDIPDEQEVVHVTSLVFNVSEPTVCIPGTQVNFTVTVLPEEADDRSVTWESDHPETAAVDDEGKMTAVAPGTAVITARSVSDPDVFAEHQVIIKPEVSSVTISEKDVVMEKGETYQLTAEVLPADAISTKVTWSSDNEFAASVDENGLVTALKGGTAIIVALTESGQLADACTVTVIAHPESIQIIEFDPATMEETVLSDIALEEGTEKQLVAKVMPLDTSDKRVTWSSDHPETAEVDRDGLVRAVSIGTAVITAKTNDGGLSASVTVTVTEIPVRGIRILNEVKYLPIGKEIQIIYAIEPKNATHQEVTFESSNPEIAPVSETGVVTGVSEGIAVITVRAGEFSDDFTVEVTQDGIYTNEVPKTFEYTGSAIKPAVQVYDSGQLLKAGTDYTLTYKNNIKAGTATITLKMKGNYTGSETITFEILPLSLQDERVRTEELTLQTTGKMLNPAPVVYFGTKKLVKGTDYTIAAYTLDGEVWDRTSPGEVTLTIQGKGNYSGEITVKASVVPKGNTLIPVNKLTVSAKSVKYQDLDGDNFEEEIIPNLTVKNGKQKLVYPDDFIVAEIPSAYRNTGTLRFVIEGTGKYTGRRTVSMKVTGISLTDKKMKNANIGTYMYNGKPQTLQDGFGLTYNGIDLEPEDFVILEDTYTNNVNAGTASVQVEGRRGFTGKRTVKFTILPNSEVITLDDITYEEEVPYAKGGAKAQIRVYDEELGLLAEGRDYTVTYTGITRIGTGSATVKFKGNYKGTDSQVLYYDILLKDISETEVTVKDVVYSSTAGKYKSTPSLKDTDKKALKAGTDYLKSYVYELDNEDGTYTLLGAKDKVPAGSKIRVTVTGRNNYTGTAYGYYRVISKGADISKAVFTVTSRQYTGEAVTLDGSSFTKALINKTTDLVYGVDYEIVSYANNIKKGTASATLHGINNYGGYKTVKFKITEKPLSEHWLDR
ncbi:MAG: Ig-like domain-containing protein [Solobacterium sp.]|nr:Ig-like domain-containing protein [Solobacterium sp.]